MKLNLTAKVPAAWDRAILTEMFKDIQELLNNLIEGRLRARFSARTAAPTSGSWGVGDKIDNSAPAVAGVALSRYVITGWVCTAAGTPGTWVEMRTLTGT